MIFEIESDIEVIIVIYVKYKEKIVECFCGMFGFVIWDK